MSDNDTKHKQAETYRRQKRYADALECYRQIIQANPHHPDRWDVWGLVLCLNQTHQYNEALEYCIRYFNQYSDFEYLRSQYAAAIYQVHVKKADPRGNLDNMRRAIDRICQLTENRTDDLMRRIALLKALDIFEEIGDWQAILNLAQKSRAQDFDLKEEKIAGENGRTITLMSQREKWYLKVTKALEKKEDFGNLLRQCDSGLQDFPRNVWLRRRRAFARFHLGQAPRALTELQEILLTKKEWFIFLDMARIHLKSKAYQQALKYAVEGCLAGKNLPKPENRWEIYFITGVILSHSGQTEMASRHIEFASALREQKEWKTPAELQDWLTRLHLTPVGTIDLVKRHSELIQFWNSYRDTNLPTQTGVIKTLLKNNISGFIRTDTNCDLYFRIKSWQGDIKSCVVGARVQFNVLESFDRIKNRPSQEAVNLKLIAPPADSLRRE